MTKASLQRIGERHGVSLEFTHIFAASGWSETSN